MLWTKIKVAILLLAALTAISSVALLGCLPANDGKSDSAAAAPQPTASAFMTADLFRDMTEQSGIAFTYRNGEEADHYSILESLGGGVALIDYDGDGLLDVFLPGGGHFEGKQVKGRGNRLYSDLGHGRFRDVTR